MAETYFYRESRENNYTVVNNEFLHKEKRLSAKSKYIFIHLLSLPEGWKIYLDELKEHFTDGITAVRAAVKELEQLGYIKQERQRNEKGVITGYVYHIIEKPEIEAENCENLQPDSPQSDFPYMGEPQMGEPNADNLTLLNTNNIKDLNKKTLVGNEPASGTVSDGGDFEKTENVPKEKHITLDADELFEKAYKLYPRKDGKVKGKQDYLNYLTDGRKIKGQPTLKYNHGQITVAIQAFSQEMTGRDIDKIQLFSTFMHTTIADYIEKTQKEYQAAMLKRYGDGWEKLKFKYTYKGQKPEKPKGGK